MLALLALLAQDVSDGVFTHKEHKLRLAVPDKDRYFLRSKDFEYGWPRTVCEISGGEGDLGGVLLVASMGRTAKDHAEWRLNSWAKQKDIHDFRTLRSEKPPARGGDWWSAEYRFQYGEAGFRYFSLYFAVPRDRKNVELALWAYESSWKTWEEPVRRIAEGFQCGDEGDPRASAVRVPENGWKDWAPGTTIVLRGVSESGGTKTESTTTLELLKNSGAAFTLRCVVDAGGTRTETVVEYLVDPDSAKSAEGEIKKERETLKVEAGEFDCEKTTTKTPKATSTVWTSRKVPGGLVKSTTDAGGGVKAASELAKILEKK